MDRSPAIVVSAMLALLLGACSDDTAKLDHRLADLALREAGPDLPPPDLQGEVAVVDLKKSDGPAVEGLKKDAPIDQPKIGDLLKVELPKGDLPKVDQLKADSQLVDQKPPDQKPLDQKPPDQKPPDQTPPDQPVPKSWKTVAANPTNTVNWYGVWGATATDIWAVGAGNGPIMHYSGTSWGAVTNYGNRDLNAIWGLSASDIWAGGMASTSFPMARVPVSRSSRSDD